VDQREVTIPDVDVRVVEIEALDLTGHVGGADNSERFAIERKVIGIDAKVRAGAEVSFIANPEGGVIDGAESGAFEQARLDDVQAFCGGGRQKSCRGSRNRNGGGLFL
jgi:hypothetical protein